MRLLNWLKKDSKSKRRQSAPPIGQEFDPNATRNQEYIRALQKFNEWRSQHLETSHQTSTGTNTSGSLLPISIPEDSVADLPMIAPQSTRPGKTNKRLSLPATSSGLPPDAESPQSRKSRREKRAVRKANDSSIMEEHQQGSSPYRKDDEVRAFEALHCQSTAVDAVVVDEHGCNSPPNRFYKKNAKPYHERLFAKTPTAATPTAATPPAKGPAPVPDTEYTTPQRRNNVPTKPTRRRKSGQSGPIPKIRNSLNCSKSMGTETDSMSEPSHVNGSYKNYDLNSSSIYDEFVISSKAYKGNLNQSVHTYQQVVNKHGEVVEYALPLVEDSSNVTATQDVQAVPDATSPEDACDSNERIIDDNFKFLTDKCNLNFSDSVRRFIFDEPSQRNGTQHLQVTDLDKSTLEKGDYQNRQEIFNELDALGRWAESIEPKKSENDMLDDKFNLNEFLFRNDTIIVSYPKEVVCRTSVLRSSIPMPLELASGMFRNSSVTVRKHSLEDKKSVRFGQEALRRDFTTLKQVRHADIVTLMAVVADRGANQMQLVLEPFDFTLNYFIHCQNNELSLSNVMIVMQQMAQAVNYLQECGHIHSNISSHAILMRQNPLCVKLGFFELVTDINSKARREIVSTYGNMMDTNGQDFNTIPDYSLLLRGSEKYVKEKYVKLSKNINLSKVNQSTHRSYPAVEVPSKYLPYFLEYRQQFSLYFYQPPELISTKSRFVLPNTLSDVYSLTLLLWELLNNCVPYVIYSYSELDKLYKTKQALLPRIVPERCGRFETVLKMGLEKDPVHRVMSIQDFVALLDDLKMSVPYDVVKKHQPVTGAELIEEARAPNRPDGKENLNINEMIQPKLATKAPFTFKTDVSPKGNHYENLIPDPQMRVENAIMNNLSLDTFETKSTTTCADFSCAFTETSRDARNAEQEHRAIQRTNGELSGGLGKGFTPTAKRRSSFTKCQKTIVKKTSPIQKKNAVKRSADNLFNLSQSTIFNSVSDIGKATESPQQQFVAMERTSTLKRKKPVSRLAPHVANVFPSPKSRCNLEDQLQEMDKGLKLSKEDLLEEFKNSPKHHVDPAEFEQVQSAGPRVNPHKGMVARARANYMKRLLYNNPDEAGQSNNLSRTMKTPNNRMVAAVPKSAPAAYQFTVGKGTLPQTPIARSNQLLKNAWLSDQKLDAQAGKSLEFDMSKSTDDILNRSFTIETQVAEELKSRKILSVEKIYRNPNSSSCNISLDESFKEKNVNVNLKIIHNNLEIFNNSVTSPGELNQKIQKIQLGMFEKEGCDSSKMTKPEIKIRLTPAKNSSVALNDLNAENHPIGKQITDLTSEIRQCFENYSENVWGEENRKKLLDDLAKGDSSEQNSPAYALESPKLILENRKSCDNEFRFENTLWHKEKSICEKSSGGGDNLDDTECEWISVPLAIKKFESISKSSSSGSPKMNKSIANPAELSIVQQSRLPNGGEAESSPHQVRDLFNDIKDGAPVATSSPLVEENIRRFNSYLKPIRLMTTNQPRPSLGGASSGIQCCPSRNVVRRSTFNDGPEQANRSDRSRRITTKVTLNLKKVQPIGSVNSSRTSDVVGGPKNESLVCANCGTCVASSLAPGTSNANLSMSMISYSHHNKPFDKTAEPLSRRSSSCSTLLKMNPMDDLYIDDDFEDNSFLTPNIELVKNDHVILFGD